MKLPVLAIQAFLHVSVCVSTGILAVTVKLIPPEFLYFLTRKRPAQCSNLMSDTCLSIIPRTRFYSPNFLKVCWVALLMFSAFVPLNVKWHLAVQSVPRMPFAFNSATVTVFLCLYLCVHTTVSAHLASTHCHFTHSAVTGPSFPRLLQLDWWQCLTCLHLSWKFFWPDYISAGSPWHPADQCKTCWSLFYFSSCWVQTSNATWCSSTVSVYKRFVCSFICLPGLLEALLHNYGVASTNMLYFVIRICQNVIVSSCAHSPCSQAVQKRC